MCYNAAECVAWREAANAGEWMDRGTSMLPKWLAWRWPLLAVWVCATTCALSASPGLASQRPHVPNVLIILADDLGFSDVGCYGGEIRTPHLDQLADNGLRFTQFYNTARCWPTRAALLTGYYAQQVRRDRVPGLAQAFRGVRPDWAPLLAEMLRPLGYRNYHCGKWHIDGMPLENGFDRSYYLRDQGRYFSPQVHFEDDQKLPPVQRESGFYGTTAIADHAVKYLREHDAKYAGQPFCLYLAFTAPHFPLHALPEDIARYRDRYHTGWNRVRRSRWRRLREMGIVTGRLSEVEEDIGPPYHFPEALQILGPGEVNRPRPWDELTSEQQEFQSAKMALHAAMIDRLDQETGRVLEQIRTMNAWENTLILFLSDNGASAEIMVRDDGHDPDARPGSASSYLCLGPGWSTTCNTPLRRHKTWVHEGGIATPLIVHWPDGIEARGELRHSPGHVVDLVPTILDIVGADHPRAEEAPVPLPGRSLVRDFAKDCASEPDYLWWCHEDNRAIRIGDWKLVADAGSDEWELYNLRKDRTETINLADRHPEKAAKLRRAWHDKWKAFCAVAAPPEPR